MSQGVQSFYEADSLYEKLTLRLVRERIGHCLRERYQVSKEFPPELLALIRKLEAIESKSPRAHTLIGTLDAIEGNYLKRYAPLVEPRSASASDAGLCALEDWLARELAMNSPLLAVIIVIVLIVGSTLSIMNKACKSGYHTWCAPIFTVRHHVKTQHPT